MFSPEKHRYENHLPVLDINYDASDNVFGQYFPIVQLESAPKIDIEKLVDSHEWLDKHLTGILSDEEYNILKNKPLETSADDPFVAFKASIRLLFHHLATSKARVFEIRCRPKNSLRLILYVPALYLDHSTNSVVAEAYVTLMSAKHESLIDNARRNSVTLVTSEEGFDYWRNTLIAMSERCRDWDHDIDFCVLDHNVNRERITKGDVCECGFGEGSTNLEDQRWAVLAPILTRIAIGPIFANPLIEGTQGWVKQELGHIMRRLGDPQLMTVCNRNGCTENGDKKCGRCGKVRYCSLECQKADWKSVHKAECGRK